MARSSYIYVVQYRSTGTVTAAFTVKHELVAWLGGRTSAIRRHGVDVCRVRACDQQVRVCDLKEFLD
jgi:hypothetical protein